VSHHVVPHACFSAAIPEDTEWPHPPAIFLARAIEAALRGAGYVVKAPENWRDGGWIVEAEANGHRLEVYFSPMGTDWLLAVAPRNEVGCLGVLLGRRNPDTSSEVRAMARRVHAVLCGLPGVAGLVWEDSGPPDIATGVPTPDHLPWPRA
jgi:hypothetical protein